MNVLTSENTSKVLHEFKFSADQVKHLKCKQFFIHTDLVEWMEEKLNSWREWSAIKIIYSKIHHHFQLDYVKCVELYYDGNIENDHLFEINGLIHINCWMPWISATTYYVTNDSQLVEDVMHSLGENRLLTWLIDQYNMSISFYGKHNIQVFTFSSELNKKQIFKLTQIFRKAISDDNSFRFISPEFLFLPSPEPPQIMKGELLTALYGGFLDWLSIEDILSLELANKDHRLSWCDRALEQDIEKHLRIRLPQLYKKRKCDLYHADDFINPKIFYYFIHKYSHRCSTIMIRNGLMRKHHLRLLQETYPNLAENNSPDYAIRVDMVSPNNSSICVVTYIVSTNEITDIIDKNINKISRRVEIGSDYFSSKDFHRIRPRVTGKSLENIRIDVLRKMNNMPTHFISVLRQIISSMPNLNRLIICFEDFDLNHLRKSILENMIPSWPIQNNFKRPRFTFEFNRMSFHIETLYKYCRMLSGMEGTDYQIDTIFNECLFILKPRIMHSLVRKYNSAAVKLKNRLHISVKFLKMRLELQTVFLILNGADGEISFDDCHINTFASITVTSEIFNINFKNMTLSNQAIVAIFNSVTKCYEVTFDNCQINFEETEICYDRLANVVCRIVNMKLQLETLLTIMDMFVSVTIENCRIHCRDESDIIANIIIESDVIYFKDMYINIHQTLAILSKRDRLKFLEFTSCHVMGDMPFSRRVHVPAGIGEASFRHMSLSPELLNLLKFFKPDCYINLIWCKISHQEVLDMCTQTLNYGQYIEIRSMIRLNSIFYFEMIAEFYKNNLDTINSEFEQDLDIPFHIFPRLLVPFDSSILWDRIKIKTIPVNDCSVKLEFLFNKKPIDLFFEFNNLPDDSDVCEVNYY